MNPKITSTNIHAKFFNFFFLTDSQSSGISDAFATSSYVK